MFQAASVSSPSGGRACFRIRQEIEGYGSIRVAPKPVAGSGLAGRRLSVIVLARRWGCIEGLIQRMINPALIRPVMTAAMALVMV